MYIYIYIYYTYSYIYIYPSLLWLAIFELIVLQLSQLFYILFDYNKQLILMYLIQLTIPILP